MTLIPAGTFEMGDHHGFVDPGHGSDEIPVHAVRLDAFYMGVTDVTTREYCEFLNASLALKQIAVRDGGVYLAGGSDLLAETRAMSPYSRIGWNGQAFAVLDGRDQHPVVCIRWARCRGVLQLAERAKVAAGRLRHRHVEHRLQQERVPPADRGRVGVRGQGWPAESLPQFPVGR